MIDGCLTHLPEEQQTRPKFGEQGQSVVVVPTSNVNTASSAASSLIVLATNCGWIVYMSLDVVRGDSPLFRRIANSLAGSIGRGDYPVGGHLPTEFALMRMFGASRFTVREALAELRSRGLVASRRGLGSVVLRAMPQEAAFREIFESIDEFLAGIVQAPVTTREVTDVVADAELAAQLRCEEGRKFIVLRGERRRLGHSEEPPIALFWAYVNAAYELLRPKLTNLTESIASTAEKFLQVRA
jgi:DNA-binding GntR family transcriptional regulator